MPLLEEMEATGNLLFRWRSYIPLVYLVILFAGLSYFKYPLESHVLDQLWEVLCLAVSFSGIAVRSLTIGTTPSHTSGRNTKEQVADHLNVTGMYSMTRNPLYFGNFLMVLGVMIFLRVWWIPLIYILFFTLYYERIIFAEEIYLRQKFGKEYLDWAFKTPAFIPRISLWRATAVPFSWKKVLRREYHGMLAVVLAQFSLEVAGDLVIENKFVLDVWWVCLVSFTIATYIVIRFLHKKTAVLKEI